jgi:DNA-binding HxlR family transcriptional regulator
MERTLGGGPVGVGQDGGRRLRDPGIHERASVGLLRQGISPKMLTQTLRGLERDGMISRTVFPVVPPRVDYALTDLGSSLLGLVNALKTWSEAHISDVAQARAAYDLRAATAAVSGMSHSGEKDVIAR